MFKIFIINLKRSTDKKSRMLEQLNKLGISNYEFVEAIDGSLLTKMDLERKVHDFENAFLTKGEIGCALSHLSIYDKMIANNISYALILEDDVVLSSDIQLFLEEIISSIGTVESKVISLGQPNRLTTQKKFWNYKEYSEYIAVSAFGTYGYLINLPAAKNLLGNLLPIRYEADMFYAFRDNGWLKYFNIVYPALVNIIDNHDEFSSIAKDRGYLIKQRKNYFTKSILKKRSFLVRFKAKINKILFRRKSVKFY